MSEKMYKCPFCEYQFGDAYMPHHKFFVGVCPRCNNREKILFKWINPKYVLRGGKR